MISVYHCFALLSFFCIWTTGSATSCYICSWSYNEKNQTDHCLPDSFRPELIGYIECNYGCESVTEWDNSGEMKIHFRNCANVKVSTEKNCQKIVQKSMSRTICSCNWHICNGALSTLPYSLFVLFLVLCISGLTLYDHV